MKEYLTLFQIERGFDRLWCLRTRNLKRSSIHPRDSVNRRSTARRYSQMPLVYIDMCLLEREKEQMLGLEALLMED
jgi:hypothetical protein